MYFVDSILLISMILIALSTLKRLDYYTGTVLTELSFLESIIIHYYRWFPTALIFALYSLGCLFISIFNLPCQLLQRVSGEIFQIVYHRILYQSRKIILTPFLFDGIEKLKLTWIVIQLSFLIRATFYRGRYGFVQRLFCSRFIDGRLGGKGIWDKASLLFVLGRKRQNVYLSIDWINYRQMKWRILRELGLLGYLIMYWTSSGLWCRSLMILRNQFQLIYWYHLCLIQTFTVLFELRTI